MIWCDCGSGLFSLLSNAVYSIDTQKSCAIGYGDKSLVISFYTKDALHAFYFLDSLFTCATEDLNRSFGALVVDS
jgi:hypothetical protein